MDILIRGMEMPMNCDDCNFDIDCPYDESQDGYKMIGGRPRKCPLVPVLPHGRLIDADDFIKRMEGLVHRAEAEGYDLGAAWYTAFIRHIELAPTAIDASE